MKTGVSKLSFPKFIDDADVLADVSIKRLLRAEKQKSVSLLLPLRIKLCSTWGSIHELVGAVSSWLWNLQFLLELSIEAQPRQGLDCFVTQATWSRRKNRIPLYYLNFGNNTGCARYLWSILRKCDCGDLRMIWYLNNLAEIGSILFEQKLLCSPRV